MTIRSDLSWSETRKISIYTSLLDCCDITTTYIKNNALEAPICERVLQLWDAGAPQPKFWRGPEQLLLAGAMRNYQQAGEIWERISVLIPELHEFQRMFAHMDILQQKLIKCWSLDTLICDNVLGSGSPTPPGVEFSQITSKAYPAGHRKTCQ